MPGGEGGGGRLCGEVGEGGEQAEEAHEARHRDGPEPLAWLRPLRVRLRVCGGAPQRACGRADFRIRTSLLRQPQILLSSCETHIQTKCFTELKDLVWLVLVLVLMLSLLFLRCCSGGKIGPQCRN